MPIRSCISAALLFIATAISAVAQTSLANSQAPRLAVKSNILYWATVTPNAALELRLAKRWTFDAEVGLNPFKNEKDDGSHGKELRHFRLHPEVRYWFCEAYYKHFIGLHVPYVIYNVSDISWLDCDNVRKQGWGAGIGVSYGYAWALSKHWNLEATVGAGWLHLDTKTYPCASCGTQRSHARKNYFGPTQAALNLTYIF